MYFGGHYYGKSFTFSYNDFKSRKNTSRTQYRLSDFKGLKGLSNIHYGILLQGYLFVLSRNIIPGVEGFEGQQNNATHIKSTYKKRTQLLYFICTSKRLSLSPFSVLVTYNANLQY